MPHENSGGGDDLASTDEVKVYKDEGDEEKRASENLSEDKLGLVIETEEGKNSDIEDRHFMRDVKSSEGQNRASIAVDHPFAGRLPFGYPFIPPYPYTGAASLSLGGVPVTPGGFPFYMYGNDLFSQPPPAHMGLTPWPLASGSHSSGLPTTPSVYGLPPTQTPPLYGIHPSQTPPLYGITHPHRQFTHPFYSSDFHHVPWASASGYPMPFTSPYSPYQLSRFSPGGMLQPHPNIPCAGVSHPTLVATCQSQDISPPASSSYTVKQRHLSFLGCGSSDSQTSSADHHHHHSSSLPNIKSPAASKIPHIKKPLNAFMLFMKEMRQKVIDECTLKESAAINQILGRKWHSLDRSEQAKYYEMAKKEKELHRQLYPTWSARDNYALHAKKKRKRDSHHDDDKECPNAKKCRARFGLDQQNQWCKPCRRKKRCIRFLQDGDEGGNGDDEDHDDDIMTGMIPAADSTTELFSPMASSISSNSDEPRGRGPGTDETFPGSISSVGPGSCLSCDDGVPLHRLSHTSGPSHDCPTTNERSVKVLNHLSSSTSSKSGIGSSAGILGLITSTIV